MSKETNNLVPALFGYHTRVIQEAYGLLGGKPSVLNEPANKAALTAVRQELSLACEKGEVTDSLAKAVVKAKLLRVSQKCDLVLNPPAKKTT